VKLVLQRNACLQEEGAYAFGDMLRANTSLKVLNLVSDFTRSFCACDVIASCVAQLCFRITSFRRAPGQALQAFVTGHMISGILHNPNLVATLPFIDMRACYFHPAWQREGLAIQEIGQCFS
jgi:hypothetical protein